MDAGACHRAPSLQRLETCAVCMLGEGDRTQKASSTCQNPHLDQQWPKFFAIMEGPVRQTLLETWTEQIEALNTGSPTERHTAAALKARQEALDAACTLRKPEVPWFSEWDAWLVQTPEADTGWMMIRFAKYVDKDPRFPPQLLYGDGTTILGELEFELLEACVPVAREGAPFPVGWTVLDPPIQET